MRPTCDLYMHALWNQNTSFSIVYMKKKKSFWTYKVELPEYAFPIQYMI